MLKYKNLFLIFMITLSFNFYSQEIITIAVDEGVKPLMYEIDGEARGLYPLLIEEIFNRMDIPVKIRPLPWKRAMFFADMGLMGVGGVYKTEERLKKYDYSEELFQETIIIYTSYPDKFEYSSIEDLFGKNIGIIRGWSYGEEFDSAKLQGKFKVEEVSTDEQNFMKLLNRRIDCLLTVKETGELILESNPQFQRYIVPLEQALIINPTYLIFSKSLNKRYFLDKFNRELFKLKESVEYTELVKEGMKI